MACLTENELLKFVQRQLPARQAVEIEQHLDQCPDCRRWVSEILRSPMLEQQPAPAGISSGRKTAPETVRSKDYLPRGTLVGRYLVLGWQGEGGMGVVYAGYDPELDRKVALKFLKQDELNDLDPKPEHSMRLMREAQSMAKLSHPNVVSVFDVGTFQGQVFLAMEFIQGYSLRRWLKQTKRSWLEIVTVFIKAGQGLAAAHAASLLHRDFKPENVLISEDGNVRVTDFGLARLVQDLDHSSALEAKPAVMEFNQKMSPLQLSLTKSGEWMGTPAYMAPEQLETQVWNARTDQFSFCVALYEALYQQHPFATGGTTVATRYMKLRSPPSESRVPGWVSRTLQKGLSREPGERFQSMPELLETLQKDPRRKRIKWMLAFALVMIAMVASWLTYWLGSQRNEFCQGASQKTEPIWNDIRRAEIQAAFLATQKPYALNLWKLAESSLDTYMNQWVSMYQEACEATHVRGEQSSELLDLRMQCLNQRLEEVAALLDVLGRGGVEVMESAAKSTASLTDTNICKDVARLTEKQKLPQDPKRRTQVEGIQKQLAQVKAQYDAGQTKEALQAASEILSQAKEARHLPTEAEAWFWLGKNQRRIEGSNVAEGSFIQAVIKGLAGGHREIVVRSWVELSNLLGAVLFRFDEGTHASLYAQALIEGGEYPQIEAEMHAYRANLYTTQAKYEKAIDSYQKALAIMERTRGKGHPEYASYLAAFGKMYSFMGNTREAQKLLQKAEEISIKHFTVDHPQTIGVSFMLGTALLMKGDYAQGLEKVLSAMERFKNNASPTHLNISVFQNNLGITYLKMGEYRMAQKYLEQALELSQATFGPNHARVVVPLDSLADYYLEIGQPQKAYEYRIKALEIIRQTLSATHPDLAMVEFGLGEIFLRQKKWDQALEQYRKAQHIWEQALGLNNPFVANCFTSVAKFHLETGRASQAIPQLEKAIQLREFWEVDPGLLAESRFLLAQALWQTGQDKPRALALARLAQESYIIRGTPRDRREHERIASWRAGKK